MHTAMTRNNAGKIRRVRRAKSCRKVNCPCSGSRRMMPVIEHEDHVHPDAPAREYLELGIKEDNGQHRSCPLSINLAAICHHGNGPWPALPAS
jgi:hypothetical protein